MKVRFKHEIILFKVEKDDDILKNGTFSKELISKIHKNFYKYEQELAFQYHYSEKEDVTYVICNPDVADSRSPEDIIKDLKIDTFEWDEIIL